MTVAKEGARPCGCDAGANHICEWHTTLHQMATGTIGNEATRGVARSYVATPPGFSLPTDPKERKKFPLTTGVIDYFPDALLAIARVSYQGNEQHNPGQPLHWAREKSTDQADTILRHLIQRGTRDTDGMRHSAKAAWRILALLQLEIEAEGKQ